MQGFVILHRKIIDWEWYTDTATKSLFIHLILMANHDDQKWRGQEIKRGEFVTSYGTLATQTGLSIHQVRTALKKLEKTGDVAIKTTNKNTLIMVINYDLYQSMCQTNDNQIAINCQSNGNQVATNNNDNKNNIYTPVFDDTDLSATENIPYDQIIGYLNEKAGTRYKISSSKTRSKINARWNEGYNLDDFLTVIDTKTSEWLGTDMEKYLRPETLFGTKFEGYLNQTKKSASDPYGSMPYI